MNPFAISTATENSKHHFLEMSDDRWAAWVLSMGEKAFRASQIIDWIYVKGFSQPELFSNMPLALRKSLAEEFDWTLPEIVNSLHSEDGSTKLLLKSVQGHLIESVILRYEHRTSLCVSSQVGCKLACTFCQTGKLGFFRHLKRWEILAQYFVARRMTLMEGRRLSHVVFMGMGEPLDNEVAVIDAANTLISSKHFGLSAYHVTISTSGIASKISTLASKTRCALAVSLHAANDALRSDLMPINRRFDLSNLKSALLSYQQQSGSMITIEYILIRNKNCSKQHAKELMSFIHGLRVKVNLIPFNPHPGIPYDRPTDDEIKTFQSYLTERSIPAPVRYSKGLGVSAACGQLAAKVISNLHDQPMRKNAIALTLP